MTKIVYAAGLVAKDLHKGQHDKGGHDYFESHLLKVASAGFDWKEKVVGFLHDAAEDCYVTVEDVVKMLDVKVAEVVDNPKGSWWEEEWWDEWMEDIDVYPCEVTHSITDEEREELKNALNLLNHHTAPSREEYIARISENRLALKVKMNDLKNNMDLNRIPQPTEKDLARIERYEKEYQKLLNVLHRSIEV
ncbi:MAG: phosphohydrolase [Muribaculaceae bacterium]|nr:phosphohydrolase [Muribaculaceae bacterium]